MATASVSITTECSICFETFNTPKILPCGHTFCLCCIEKCIGDRRETFRCPFCQQDVKIPEGGGKEFTTNFIVQPSKHKHTQNQAPSTTQPKCLNHYQKAVNYDCNNGNILCSYQFLINVKDIKKRSKIVYNSDKFRNNNLVWSCGLVRYGGALYIHIQLSPDENPKLKYCVIDYQIRLLNIDDDSKSLTKTDSEKRVERGGLWGWNRLTWSELSDKNNGYSNAKNQFLVQFNLTQIREIEFSQ